MDRLQKKCFIAATGLHLFLISLLFIGPAFLSSDTKMPDEPLITFIPYKTTDQNISGGGDPKGGAPAPAPLPQPPAPAPEPVRTAAPEPTPEKQEPAPKAPKEPAPKETTTPRDTNEKSKPPKREISTTIVRRSTSTTSAAAKAKAAADARAAAAARQRAINQMANALSEIGGSLSGDTSIKDPRGPGGGGLPYANFLQGVKKIYSDAWILPDGIKDDTATVSVSVTIARDGTVISSRILQRSGDAAVNSSVQMTLDRVGRVVPLPDDSKESQRTVTINFNVKSKLLG
jgi:TonB family protein